MAQQQAEGGSVAAVRAPRPLADPVANMRQLRQRICAQRAMDQGLTLFGAGDHTDPPLAAGFNAGNTGGNAGTGGGNTGGNTGTGIGTGTPQAAAATHPSQQPTPAAASASVPAPARDASATPAGTVSDTSVTRVAGGALAAHPPPPDRSLQLLLRAFALFILFSPFFLLGVPLLLLSQYVESDASSQAPAHGPVQGVGAQAVEVEGAEGVATLDTAVPFPGVTLEGADGVTAASFVGVASAEQQEADDEAAAAALLLQRQRVHQEARSSVSVPRTFPPKIQSILGIFTLKQNCCWECVTLK